MKQVMRIGVLVTPWLMSVALPIGLFPGFVDSNVVSFWTPGPDGAFDGKVDFAKDGYPTWKSRNHHFVQLLDTMKVNRPPATYCNMSRRKTSKRIK